MQPDWHSDGQEGSKNYSALSPIDRNTLFADNCARETAKKRNGRSARNQRDRRQVHTHGEPGTFYFAKFLLELEIFI